MSGDTNGLALPTELSSAMRWVVWRKVERGGKTDKRPYDFRTNQLGDVTDPAVWTSYHKATEAATSGGFDGIGYVFTENDRITGIDLDRSLDEQGAIEPWAERIVLGLDSFTEVSPSGRGLHIYVRGRLAESSRHKVGGFGPDGSGAVEVYDRGRYFTVTGRHLAGSRNTIEERQEELDAFCREWFPPAEQGSAEARPTGAVVDDEFVLRMARTSKGSERFCRLFDDGEITGFGSQSDADLSLCSSLFFWTGGDAATVDRLFRRSALMRDKWDRSAGAMTYGQRTIVKASNGHRTLYDPGTRPVEDEEFDPDLDRDATAADLIAAQVTIRWVWKDWFPLGVLTILASEPGVGKTRFCADLLRRINLGLEWPDGAANDLPSGQKVLWVPADNQHAEIGSFPAAFGFDAEALVLNAPVRAMYGGTMLDSTEDLKDFEARIGRVRPVFVFIDTSLNATDRSSHKPEDAKAFFKPLQEIAARTQTSIVCVTHLNAGGKPLGRRIMGQGRVVIQLEQPDPEGQADRRKLYVVKSNSLFPPALGVTMGSSGNEYDDNPPVAPDLDGGGAIGPARPTKLNECLEWLKDRLADGEPKRVSDLRTAAEVAGFSVTTLYAAKDKSGVHEFIVERYKWWELRTDDPPF